MMLPPEPAVLVGRQDFEDAQSQMGGAATVLGVTDVSWYGTDVSDERGSFGLVDPGGQLYSYVGDFVQITLGQRSVTVYLIGSYSQLSTPVAITRRAYLALSPLAVEPISAVVSLVS